MFLEKLEQMHTKYHSFLRPRRFGKSLAVSVMQHYYGKEDKADFQEIVSQNGFVRKFFEILKEGTQSGRVDRIFITGVSPVTLDSLTSGFNICDNLSTNLDMHDFMGFREPEVQVFLEGDGGELRLGKN